jgi:hypothetical protein
MALVSFEVFQPSVVYVTPTATRPDKNWPCKFQDSAWYHTLLNYLMIYGLSQLFEETSILSYSLGRCQECKGLQ